MTLNERYKVTNGWTARHVVSDEIANFGGDWEVSAYQEQKFQNAERQDRLRAHFATSGIVSIGNGIYANTRRKSRR